MGSLDWVVIGVYASAMLLVGCYYSRRTATTEDYLLGGRTMRPLNVGLSLFASLLSTLSYLGWPGEIIAYGPMMAFVFAANPLTAYVVGWIIIPRIMKLRVTSAYEILESRLGLGVRLIGSTLFLSVRLLWMAVIIYATASKVLVPILGLDPTDTPYLCLAMGLVTVIYTSMGGLRAVVVTDVAQFAILFGAIVATLAIITADLGGVAAWWPGRWPGHWPEPQFGYSPGVRVTAVGAILAHFTWWICTATSDQMAIQRYLATQNAKAARRALITALTADAVIGALLAVLGLALLGYCKANPSLLPAGETILTNPESLFPRFAVSRMFMGIGGLVIAGLLSAAMSSLSSGMNASCSVVMVDFLDRFRPGERKEAARVMQARVVSVVIGVVAVALSCCVGMLQRNLIEICYVVINLPVAPLFGLFFLALFVRWATSLGAILGAVFSLGTVVAISYWDELTGTPGISFLWALPLGVLASLAVGMSASLLPFGRRAYQAIDNFDRP